MNNRPLFPLVLMLLLTLSAQAQFSNNGRVTNRANRISERQLSFIVKANSLYTGTKQGIFVHQGPSARTLVNLGSFTADTNHTDIFQGPGGKPGPQEIAGRVRPYFFNLALQNGANQSITISNTDGANVRGLATFANGLTTTVRSLTTAGALRFDTQARYTGGLTDAQHVDGYVSKVGSTSFTFPVGSSTDSRPLTISAPLVATDQVGVAWIEGDPTTTPDPSDASALHPISQFDTRTLTAVSPVGQWDWVPLNGTGAGLAIRVTIPDMSGFSSPASLRLVGWNGRQWVNLSTGEKPYSAGRSYASFNTDNSILTGTMVAGITAIGIGRFPSEIQLSGNLFDDGNGLTDGLVNQVGLGPKPVNGTDIDPLRSGSQPLFVSLVGSAGYALFTEPVSTSGTYSFSAVTADTYSVVLSTNPQGSITPSLPTSWTATGEHLGTGPGNDGLADGILTGVTVTTAAVTNANFGIDRLPEGASVVLATQPNPGGGGRTPIPASAFTATDLEDGTYASNLAGRFVSLRPASGGTLYYQGNPVSTALDIPIFDPTQVSLDPSSNNATTADFSYVLRDNANVSSNSTLNPIYISQPFTGASISIAGNLFDDGNGLTDNTVNQTGQGPNPLDGTAVPSATDSPTPLFVSLTIDGNVFTTVPVSSAGSYSFSSVQGNSAYTLVLSTNSAGSVEPSLPSSWTYTGEFLGTSAGNDFTPDGRLQVSIGSASRTNANFGIDQRPVARPVTLARQPNPEGSAQAPVSTTAFSATDREDGDYPSNLTGRAVSLSAAVGGTLYYSTTAVSTSLSVTSFDPTKLTLDPTAPGSTTASFTYRVRDNAGVSSEPATITLPFGPPVVSLSGNVFDDGNGLTDNTINGPGVNGPSLPVYVSLVDETTLVETVPVSVSGFFKFLSVQANKVYKLILSTVASGSQTPSLPTQWVNTGESVPDANKPLAVPGGGSGLRRQQTLGVDATVDGVLSVQVNATDVLEANFGIEQQPQVMASVLPLQPNPKARNRAPVYASAFSGSDPEDGTYASNLTGRTVRLSAATGGTLYYQNSPISEDQTIARFDPMQLALDPTATGATTAIFTYAVKDQAGVESTLKPITVPFYDDEDQNDDNNDPDPETKIIKLPEFSFTIIIPPLLLPPIILPPLPIFGILIPSFPTNVSSLTIGTTVYTKDTFPPKGVVVKTDEEGKLTEDVLVDPILEDQPTGVPFQALGPGATPISAVGVLTINPPTPDVSPVLYARPSVSYGTTNASVVITVSELTAVPTQGLITVRLTKDPRLQLSFDASQTMVGGRPVQNSVWRVDDSQADYYILTTDHRLEADALLSIGLTGQLSPGATTGVLTVSATLVGNSGGEVNIINNIDSDKIEYFQR